MRLAKSVTIEPDLIEYVDKTKGDASASDRVNALLRRAMIQEQCEKLEAAATEFYADAQADRTEAKSFQKAALRGFGMD